MGVLWDRSTVCVPGRSLQETSDPSEESRALH